MPALRILFYSGSIGLGHVTRDLALVRVIRGLSPDAHIEWLASSPAREHLLEAGECLHPDANRLSDATSAAETFMQRGSFNITRWAVAVRHSWAADGRFALSVAATGDYDAMIGDEAYDVAMSLTNGEPHPTCPCFVLYDFLGLDRMGMHPVEWIGVDAINRAWARDPRGHYQAVFLGELEDVPRRRFGLCGPTRREWARRNASIAGHVLPFDLEKLGDRAALRARLGYGPEPLLVVAVGGTGAGSALLDLCLEAFPAARREMPGLQMLLVCGPRVAPPAGDLPPGVETRGYVPTLHEHFAVCDLAIVQGGSTATLELTALQRPFLFFPLQGHCEQMKHVAARQRRLGAGVQLDLGRTTAAALSRQIVSTIGGEVHYPPLKADGAREIARLVLEAAGERPAP